MLTFRFTTLVSRSPRPFCFPLIYCIFCCSTSGVLHVLSDGLDRHPGSPLLHPRKPKIGVRRDVDSYHRTDRFDREWAQLLQSHDGNALRETALRAHFDEVVVELSRDKKESIDRGGWLCRRIGKYGFEFRSWKEELEGR